MEMRSATFNYPYDRLHQIATRPFIESSAAILNEVKHLDSPHREKLFVTLVLAANEDRNLMRQSLAA